MKLVRTPLLLVLLPLFAACGEADPEAPCTDLEVRKTALTSIGAAMVVSMVGDNSLTAQVRDDRYVVHIPRQYRRAIGMDSLVVQYEFDDQDNIVLQWPRDSGLPQVNYSITETRMVSTSDDGQMVACEGDVLLGQNGEFINVQPLTFRIQRLADGRLNVFGRAGDIAFQSSRSGSNPAQAGPAPSPATRESPAQDATPPAQGELPAYDVQSRADRQREVADTVTVPPVREGELPAYDVEVSDPGGETQPPDADLPAYDVESTDPDAAVASAWDGVDDFSAESLAAYGTQAQAGSGAGIWSIADGSLVARAQGDAAVVGLILRGVQLQDGRLQFETTNMADGGLIFRLQDPENFYYLAVRDDQSGYRNKTLRNFEFYVMEANRQTPLFRENLTFPRGSVSRVTVEFVGSHLSFYHNGSLVKRIEDDRFNGEGGIGLLHDDRLTPGEASYFDAFRWKAL